MRTNLYLRPGNRPERTHPSSTRHYLYPIEKLLESYYVGEVGNSGYDTILLWS